MAISFLNQFTFVCSLTELPDLGGSGLAE